MAGDTTDTVDIDVTAKALTDWKNEPTLRDLKQDYTDTKSDHDTQRGKIDTWLDNLNVTGKAQINSPKGSSRIVPKVIRKQAEWRYAALSEPFLSSEDVFKVSPVTWEDKDAAYQNQLVLNSQLNTQIKKTQFIDEYVRTVVDEGTAIVRVGWDFEEEQYEEEVPLFEFVPDPEMEQVHEELAQMAEQSPSQFEEVPDELKAAHELSMEHQMPMRPLPTGEVVLETKTRTLRNRPTLEICDYRNIFIDPTCKGDLDKAGFVVYSFESSLAQLKKDGKYQNLDNINTSTNSILGEPDHATEQGSHNFNFSDKPRKKFVVYEYWGFWDINGTGQVEPFVAAWVGDTLIRMEENPFPDKKLPFVAVAYLPVRRSIYGEPDGALLEENQKIAGAVTRGMIDILGKIANGQQGTRKDALDVTNKRKFEQGRDYEFNANVDPRQAIHMHTYPEIPNSAQFMLQLQNLEAESLTGVKAFTGGISGEGLGKTATGVRGALDAASKRELGILRRLAEGIIQIGRKFISMNSEFLSDVEVVRITNEHFVPVRREDLAGKFDLKLSISTAEEDSKKVEQLAFMLQTIGGNLDPSITRTILADIAKLQKMPDLAQKLENFQEPEPDPLAVRMQEAEVALKEAEVMTEQAKAQEYGSKGQLNMTKAEESQAKTANISSDTDSKNLDFVEQESGVKQERDLERQGEQARSQAELKMMDRSFEKEDRLQQTLKDFLEKR